MKKIRVAFFLLFVVCACITVLCGACGEQRSADLSLPSLLRPPASEAEVSARPSSGEPKAEPKEGEATKFEATPRPPALSAPPKMKVSKEELELKGEPVEVNFDGLALPAFINEVYGNILRLSFEIDPGLQNKRDLVTLRTAEPISPTELDRLARQVLGNYGVAVEKQGALLRFVPTRPGAVEGEPPLLISGRTLPEVPVSHRPVFMFVPMKIVRNIHVGNWLRQAYQGQNLTILEDPERNAVILKGPPALVEEALQAVHFLDQPLMSGRHSLRVEPVYLDPAQLAGLLQQVMVSEGYTVPGALIILPVKEVNAVLLFASEADVLEHARQWVSTLDRPGREEAKKRSMHYYQVRNTNASEIHKVLNNMLGGITAEVQAQKGEASDAKAPAAQTSPNVLVVDEVRNGLIFQGNPEVWEELLAVVREMDLPARMVLIEVTVAEITLDDSQELGVEWLLTDLGIKGMVGSLGTMGGLGVGGGGMSYMLNNAGQTRAVLNAFAEKSRVTILSTPRIMVKSGSTASIDVGTEVPTVTRQSTSSEIQQEGTSGLVQEIQYRKTGVLLKVTPVVHSGNRVDLDITQEVSESKPAPAGGVQSPSIFTRKIETALGLQDGGSIILGGLISSGGTQGYTGVPYLSEIPGVGRLFRVEKEQQSRTEMVMLIVPYVIEDSQDAAAITQAFKKHLSGIEAAGQTP